MKKSGEIIYAFLFGCFLYSLIEIAARGFTHWSMTLTGGICFSYIYHITNGSKMSLVRKCAAGAVFITSVEFLVGIYDNIILSNLLILYSRHIVIHQNRIKINIRFIAKKFLYNCTGMPVTHRY